MSGKWNRASFACMLLCWLGIASTSWAQDNPNDPNCSPANLLMVVDTSGSMSSAGKLSGLKAAAANVVNTFKSKLRMGLIRFSAGEAKLLVPLGPAHAKTPDVNGHAQKLLSAIQGLKAIGDTPMSKAMDLALQTYTKEIPTDPLHKDPDPAVKRRNFVLLVTDGEPTDATPTYNPMMFIKALRKLQIGTKTYDIFTFVVGLGSGQQIRTYELKQYAIAGGTQNFLHALVPADLAPFFNKVSNTASTETCNGRDDDCDGSNDEDLERECQNNCGKGKEICHKGKWSKCDAPAPKTEVCDGRDNNCNGKVDEDLERPCQTQCGKGTQSCIQGDWSTCTAPRPEPEVCDGTDNDCDGQIDNGSPCPGGKCIIGANGKAFCKIRCSPDGECPTKFLCDRTTWDCVEKPCSRKKCPPGTLCSDKDGTAKCVDPCAGVTCTPGLTCGESGTCINCYLKPCAQGMVCKGGKCLADPCKNSNCPDGQACRDGKCFDSCDGVQCGPGERCVKGRCQKDPCNGVQCNGGQVCVNGQCIQDRCRSTADCGSKRICNPQNGACEDDPCARTTCPQNQTCFNGECGVSKPPKSGDPGSYCDTATDCKPINGSAAICKNKRCTQPVVCGSSLGGDCIPPEGCPGCSSRGKGPSTQPLFWMAGLWLLLLAMRRRLL